jgi:hypothetical protein
MVVWGGAGSSGYLADGAYYVPSTNTWNKMSTAPLSARLPVAAAWFPSTGRFTVWGSAVGLENDGAAWQALGDSWTTIAAAPLAGRGMAAVGSDASSLTIWGGFDNSLNPFLDGARYSASTGSWTRLPDPPSSFIARLIPSIAPLDDGFALFGGASYSGDHDDGLAWFKGAWHSIPSAPIGSSPAKHWYGASWCIGHSCYVWSGGVSEGAGTLLSTGAAIDVDAGTWTSMPTANAPAPRDSATTVVAGSYAIVWGGANDTKTATIAFADGALYVP